MPQCFLCWGISFYQHVYNFSIFLLISLHCGSIFVVGDKIMNKFFIE